LIWSAGFGCYHYYTPISPRDGAYANGSAKKVNLGHGHSQTTAATITKYALKMQGRPNRTRRPRIAKAGKKKKEGKTEKKVLK